MTVQGLVWCGVERGDVSRELSITTRQEIMTITYVFALLLMIQLVMGDYK
jgi:hypothetical protein